MIKNWCYFVATRATKWEIKAIYVLLNTNHKIDRTLSLVRRRWGTSLEDSAIITYRLARLINCPVVATGEEDYVSDGTRVLQCPHGHPIMTTVTGTGRFISRLSCIFSSYYPFMHTMSIGEFLCVCTGLLMDLLVKVVKVSGKTW